MKTLLRICVGAAAAVLGGATPAPAATPRSGQALQKVWVVGAGTAWAWTQDETGPIRGGGAQAVDVTNDGGGSWSDVTPPGLAVQRGRHWIGGLFALNTTDAWVTYGILGGGRTLLGTTDGGRQWKDVGREPADDCGLQFVSPAVGWCTSIGGATGNETVGLYRTTDGGQRWKLVSVTPLSTRRRPGALPFEGDRTIEFSNALTGWAPFEFQAGTAPLFETDDGGSTWIPRSVAAPPVTNAGGAFEGMPLVRGRDGAVPYSDFGAGGPFTIIYVTADAGLHWRPVVPPGPPRPWLVDTVTPQVWRLLDGRRILETGDAGRNWETVIADHRFPLIGSDYESPPPPVVDFITTRIGWVAQVEPGTALSGIWRTVDAGHTWTDLKVPGTA